MPEAGFLRENFGSANAPAVFDGISGEWLTRGRLTDLVSCFADRLRFPRKALVFVFPLNDAGSLIAYLAAIQAGHAVATLNPELDESLKTRLIARFQPDFLVAPPTHIPEACAGDSVYQPLGAPGTGPVVYRSDSSDGLEIHPDLSLLLSTSGSTGSPKLVRLSWRNLASNAWQIIEALGHNDRDRNMVTAPIFNGYGQSVVHSMLLSGGSFVLTRARLVSREFWDTARTAECNVIGGTPFFYQTLSRLDPEALSISRVKKFVQSAGKLPGHLALQFHRVAEQRGGELHLMYGQAEATARISGLPPALLPGAHGSVGFALPGGRLRIERDGCECAPMDEGELVYQGPNVMMGYATCREDLAKGDELGGTVATGDLGYRDLRGLFYITGRKSRFAKLNGWRVSLDEIEELLSPAAIVAAVNVEDRVVIYAEQAGPAFDGAVDGLAGKLNLHRSGFEVRAVDAIPRLANGKIDYRSLTHGAHAASAR